MSHNEKHHPTNRAETGNRDREILQRLAIPDYDPQGRAEQMAKLRITHGTRRPGGMMFEADFAQGYTLPQGTTVLYNAGLRLPYSWKQYTGLFKENKYIPFEDQPNSVFIRYEDQADDSVDCWVIEGEKTDVMVGMSRLAEPEAK